MIWLYLVASFFLTGAVLVAVRRVRPPTAPDRDWEAVTARRHRARSWRDEL